MVEITNQIMAYFEDPIRGSADSEELKPNRFEINASTIETLKIDIF